MFARLRAVAPTLLKIGAGAGVIGLTSNVVYAQSKSTPQDEDLKLELPELTKENLKLDKEYTQYLESQEGTYRSNSDESDEPVFSIPEKDQNLPSGETKDPQNPAEAYNPETGEIDWDCPCLGGMAQGPCGEEFKQAFSCFIFSKSEVRGAECLSKFGAMQSCFKKHPEVYAEYLTAEDK